MVPEDRPDGGDRELRLERLSWPQVADALADGNRTIVLACGAIEQHGPHLPLVVDTQHAGELSVAVARRLGGCLVAPVLSLGCSSHHMHFPGTVSLKAETLERVLTDCATSLAAHGFEAICCFSTHGGNFETLGAVEYRIDSQLGPDRRFVAFSDQHRFLKVWQDTVGQVVGRASQVGGHADIAESSIALELIPELVDRAKASAGYVGELDPELSERVRKEGVQSLSDNGVIGDPTGMTADLGRACIESMAAMLAAYFGSRLGQGHTR
jgi:creatinine amidohydrolase